jgi:hypothetical protein
MDTIHKYENAVSTYNQLKQDLGPDEFSRMIRR